MLLRRFSSAYYCFFFCIVLRTMLFIFELLLDFIPKPFLLSSALAVVGAPVVGPEICAVSSVRF